MGRGEAEAIALAAELGAGTAIILDDRQARRLAASYGLSVVGTVGVLLGGKRIGILQEIRAPLDALRASGLYLSLVEHERALGLAGEG